MSGESEKLVGRYPDFIEDREGFERLKAAVLEAADRHEMAGINLNTLGRLLGTIATLKQTIEDDADRFQRMDERVATLTAERDGMREALEPLVKAAEGLALGEDWNNGTMAKTHGYRRKLLKAIPKARGARHGVSWSEPQGAAA